MACSLVFCQDAFIDHAINNRLSGAEGLSSGSLVFALDSTKNLLNLCADHRTVARVACTAYDSLARAFFCLW